MSDSLLKANYIVVKNDEKRVIDTNQIVSDRIKLLSEILEMEQMRTEEDISEGFVEGLDALQVEQLLTDSEGENFEGFTPREVPSVDVQQIIDDANAQADAIIADAQQQAENIIANARAEGEALKNSAVNDGHQQGYNSGYQEGLAQAEAMSAELERKAALMEEDYERRVAELEPAFVETLTDIYSHVFGIELKGNNDVIMHLLKDAIRNVEGSKTYLIHVSKFDYQFVSDSKDELMAGLGNNVTLEVIEDISLNQSECFVEAESGIFDCGLGIELELLKKELVLLSYRREN